MNYTYCHSAPQNLRSRSATVFKIRSDQSRCNLLRTVHAVQSRPDQSLLSSVFPQNGNTGLISMNLYPGRTDTKWGGAIATEEWEVRAHRFRWPASRR